MLSGVLISVTQVRDPYAFWRSRFTYAWNCQFAIYCTPGSVKTFEQFMALVGGGPGHTVEPWIGQSKIVRDQCGEPCKHDYLLHTEVLCSHPTL